MIINIRELAMKGNTIEFHEQLDMSGMIKDRKEIAASKPLQADLQAKYEAGAVQVTGRLSAELELVCSRCLSHFDETLNIPFREAFSLVKDHPVQDDNEEDNIHLVSEEKVELKPYVEENVLLELPYIPLCMDSCKGLCSQCGINRNEQSCDCSQEKIDPRLAGLKDFFKQ